ncbi:uncharacterized protein LOC143922832 [Arctopsyche grandis]|uniref:uncharacterized protein LOC143922832 n=2 Tax=Arctopsyche grandis TaxID=121162 RepID=UPI00406D926C
MGDQSQARIRNAGSVVVVVVVVVVGDCGLTAGACAALVAVSSPSVADQSNFVTSFENNMYSPYDSEPSSDTEMASDAETPTDREMLTEHEVSTDDESLPDSYTFNHKRAKRMRVSNSSDNDSGEGSIATLRGTSDSDSERSSLATVRGNSDNDRDSGLCQASTILYETSDSDSEVSQTPSTLYRASNRDVKMRNPVSRMSICSDAGPSKCSESDVEMMSVRSASPTKMSISEAGSSSNELSDVEMRSRSSVSPTKICDSDVELMSIGSSTL